MAGRKRKLPVDFEPEPWLEPVSDEEGQWRLVHSEFPVQSALDADDGFRDEVAIQDNEESTEEEEEEDLEDGQEQDQELEQQLELEQHGTHREEDNEQQELLVGQSPMHFIEEAADGEEAILHNEPGHVQEQNQEEEDEEEEEQDEEDEEEEEEEDEEQEEQEEQEQEQEQGEGEEDGPDHETFDFVLQALIKKWIITESDHHVSKTASNEFWKVADEFFFRLYKAKEREKNRKKVSQFLHTRRKLYSKHVPKITMTVAYEHKETKEVTIVKSLESTPTSRFPPNLYNKLYEAASVKVIIYHLVIEYRVVACMFFSNIKFIPSFFWQAKDIHELHNRTCPQGVNGPLPVQISNDGVKECRSNSVSLDVYSTKVLGCKNVYPLKIVRHISKTFKDETDHLDDMISDMIQNFFKILQFIADNPKRALAKMCLNHASIFPCEYCFAQGIRALIQAATANSKKKTKIVWPASTRNGEPRTQQKLEEIIEKIEENPNISKLEKKGVVGRSPLFKIPSFDVVRDSPTEYMHTVCIGVVKRMVELTFAVGDNRKRITKRKLSSTVEFDLCMLETRLPRESSRRSRKMDFAVMKATEMRNLLIFFFPHVLQCIESNAKERKLWLLLAFSIRACVIPSVEFQPLDLDEIDESSKQFYELYEKLFGEENCTYNTHVVGSHTLEMRVHGPLTFTSAFPFENFYGEMRHAFAPGTQSTLKQIFQKILLKRALSYHCCENTIFFSDHEHDSPQECNSLIYCYTQNEHKMYKIIKVEQHHLLCYPQGKYRYSFPEASDLSWS